MNTKLISRAISLLAVISLLVSPLMLVQAHHQHGQLYPNSPQRWAEGGRRRAYDRDSPGQLYRRQL